MGNIVDKLHDEIDQKEELGDRARRVVTDVAAKTIKTAQSLENFRDIFEAIAVIVEDGITEITTDAVRQGFDAAKGRSE